ncbi:Gti1/Pac2 family-domain-containing protein [Mycena filopes]|nr:Gti1/Pac2 family-domain-containing protein [Mycena filopes]
MTIPPTPPFRGFISTTGDALIILEAARRGLIPRVTRRISAAERPPLIASGSVFVFDEGESGIRRWTDGRVWSPSRVLGNFLIYREMGGSAGSGRRRAASDAEDAMPARTTRDSLSRPRKTAGKAKPPGMDRSRERTLVGSLTDGNKFKRDGLMKKTLSVSIAGVAQHLISYYKVSDVEAGRLRAPSSLPELASLNIDPTLLHPDHFRCPPKTEVDIDGIPRYRGESDEVLALTGSGSAILDPAPAAASSSSLLPPRRPVGANANGRNAGAVLIKTDNERRPQNESEEGSETEEEDDGNRQEEEDDGEETVSEDGEAENEKERVKEKRVGQPIG